MRMLKALFTTRETKTDEWVPPSMSDTVAVNRLGVKWFETRSVSSSRKSEISVRPRGTRPVPPVEDSQQPATDLDEIGLPESVSTPDSGEDTAGENGFDN
jgi:hypothetical protein